MPHTVTAPLIEGPVLFDGAPDKGTARWEYQQVRDEQRFVQRFAQANREEFKRALRWAYGRPDFQAAAKRRQRIRAQRETYVDPMRWEDYV